MAIELPNLDDKPYAELVDEARSALPGIYPGWTDHNPSDPGIALIELLAWLTEMLIYRTGRISEPTERAFLLLLSGGAQGIETQDLESARRSTLAALRERYRAVTPEDVEHLLLQAPEAIRIRIRRGGCIPERNLAAADKTARAPGHLGLLLMPTGYDPWGDPSEDLRNDVAKFFRDRLLISTRLCIAAPAPVDIQVSATLCLRGDTPVTREDVENAAKQAIDDHFHPWTGGPERRGWPFGRDVYLSDVLAVLDDLRAVDFVESVQLTADPDVRGSRAIEDRQSEKTIGLRIEAHELPRFSRIDLTRKTLRGNQWVTIA
jgi:hypothetical protein